MSDDRLRELERRWRETGTREDEAAFLAERVRVGIIRRENLVLAAHLGHVSSRLALSEPPRQVDLGDALSMLQSLDRRLLCKAMTLLAEKVLERWDRVMKDPRPRGVLREVAAWVDRPDRAAARRVQEATDAAAESADGTGYFLAQNFPEGAFTMGEMAEIEAIARSAQHAGELAVALTMRPRDSEALDAAVARFAQCIGATGLESGAALNLLGELLARLG